MQFAIVLMKEYQHSSKLCRIPRIDGRHFCGAL